MYQDLASSRGCISVKMKIATQVSEGCKFLSKENTLPGTIKQSNAVMTFRWDLQLHIFSTKYKS